MAWYVFLFALLLLFVYAYRNTFQVRQNRVSIQINHPNPGSDTASHSLRILHLSDLHMERLSISAERIVRDWQNEPLDLIVITGDFLDRARNIPKALAFVGALQTLQPKLGTYAVFGNHDYLLPPKELTRFKTGLEQLGCCVLQNEAVSLDWNHGKLHLIGVDDYATRRSDLARSFAAVRGEGIRLVLTHDPNLVLTMKAYRYDYLLAGHFHGGQIHWPRPFHLRQMGELPRMNKIKGLHHYNQRPFYISEGLGQTGLNIRLRSRPEVTLHTLAVLRQPAASTATTAVPISWEAASALAIDG